MKTTTKKTTTKTAVSAPITVPADMGANAKFPFAILCIAAKDSSVSYERFASKPKRDARLRVLEGDKTLAAARAEDWKGAPKAKLDAAALKGTEAKATAKAKQASADLKVALAKPTAKPAADGALTVTLNTRGRLYFGTNAAERVADMKYFAISAKGKSIIVAATKTKGEGQAIKRLNGRPRVRVTRLLREMEWNGKALAIDAKPLGDAGFELALGKAVK